jgi:hypothetical protein
MNELIRKKWVVFCLVALLAALALVLPAPVGALVEAHAAGGWNDQLCGRGRLHRSVRAGSRCGEHGYGETIPRGYGESDCGLV